MAKVRSSGSRGRHRTASFGSASMERGLDLRQARPAPARRMGEAALPLCQPLLGMADIRSPVDAGSISALAGVAHGVRNVWVRRQGMTLYAPPASMTFCQAVFKSVLAFPLMAKV